MLKVLISLGLVKKSMSMRDLRKAVLDHAMANMDLFIGREKDGSDMILTNFNGDREDGLS